MIEMKKIHDRLLFNFLAADSENAREVLEAAQGFVIPGITAAGVSDVAAGVAQVRQLQEAAPVVSIGLGGNGDTTMWRKALEIALLAAPGHLNQPFETSAYARGALESSARPHLVNALVAPAGRVGFVKLASGQEIAVEAFVELAAAQGVQSIKLMPLCGLQHLDELVDLARHAAAAGIYGLEPAGGIDVGNVQEIVDAVLQTDIAFFMPHIFGSTLDPDTGRTRPQKVAEIVQPFLIPAF